MGDYFEEDDLINDYMDEEGTPEENSRFMDAYDEEQHESDATPSEKEDDMYIPKVPIDEVVLAQRPEKDPYSFERYNGSMTLEWRQKTMTEEDAFTATEWKRQTNKDNVDSSNIRKRKATELVDFWNHAHRSQQQIMYHPDASSLVPSVGSESMTLQNGTRIHVAAKKNVSSSSTELRGNNLLGISMSTLMTKSDAVLRKAEQNKIIRRVYSDDDYVAPRNHQISTSEQQLWVDKHAPTVFSHLLSNERTNREVLRAIRAWDPYVFRKLAPKRATSDPILEGNKHDSRPDERSRVILISGPPGVGKTTLAHIIARHAGYRPLEVNASDERSASILKERVIRAMESSTLNLPRKDGLIDCMAGRPNCLILDEIDGADAKDSIAALVEIIRAEIPTTKKKGVYLRRPMIFICNHKYAQALRPLLPYAKHFDVSSPSENRLVARLRAVLAEERLSVFAGSSMLHQLVTGTGGDIRSCIHTLQFASFRARELATTSSEIIVDVSSTLKRALKGDGMKDTRNDIAGTVTAIFRKVKGRQGAANPETMTNVLHAVEVFGENSKTIDCLFTNINNVSYIDPTLDRSVVAHEWLSGADIYRSNKIALASNNHAAHNTMQRYHLPSAAAAIHLLCRVETRAELTFSTKVMFENFYNGEANTGLVHKFVEGLSPKARCNITAGIAVSEIIPFALWMLSANSTLTRPVSSVTILSRNGQLAFASHVSTLRGLGLTYVGDTKPSGFTSENVSADMRMEPAIDTLSTFLGFMVPEDQRRAVVPSAMKELLAHHAHLESLLDREYKSPEHVNKSPTPKDSNETPTQHAKMSSSHMVVPKRRSQPTCAVKNFLVLGAVKAKTAKSKRKAAIVGFDRSKRFKKSNSGSGVSFNQIVRFKYQKGFTQAVRTCCRMEDLI